METTRAGRASGGDARGGCGGSEEIDVGDIEGAAEGVTQVVDVYTSFDPEARKRAAREPTKRE